MLCFSANVMLSVLIIRGIQQKMVMNNFRSIKTACLSKGELLGKGKCVGWVGVGWRVELKYSLNVLQ